MLFTCWFAPAVHKYVLVSSRPNLLWADSRIGWGDGSDTMDEPHASTRAEDSGKIFWGRRCPEKRLQTPAAKGWKEKLVGEVSKADQKSATGINHQSTVICA